MRKFGTLKLASGNWEENSLEDCLWLNHVRKILVLSCWNLADVMKRLTSKIAHGLVRARNFGTLLLERNRWEVTIDFENRLLCMNQNQKFWVLSCRNVTNERKRLTSKIAYHARIRARNFGTHLLERNRWEENIDFENRLLCLNHKQQLWYSPVGT